MASSDYAVLLEEVLSLMGTFKYFDAASVLEKLDAALEEGKDSDEAKQFKESITKEQESNLNRLRADIVVLKEMVAELQSDDDWELGAEKAGIKTFMKAHPDLEYTLVTVKGRCEINAPVQNVVMLMNEIDLYHKWVPLVKDGANLLEINPFDKIMHVMFSFPMPINFVMSARDSIFHGYVVRTDHDGKPAWAVNVRDSREDEKERFMEEHNFEVPESTKGYCRCQLVNGGMYLVPHGRDKCTVECMLSINPQLNLPTTITSLLCRKFGYLFFEMLSKRSVKLGKEYDGRLEKELYATIKADLEAAFDE